MKFLYPAVASAVLVFVGCGGASDERLPTTPVEGTVTLDGEPLSQGTISFFPVAGGKHATGVINDGKFVLATYEPQDGAVVGQHKVVVQVSAITADGTTVPAEELPPDSYASADTTPLTVEVTEDGGPMEIKLTR